MGPTSPGLAGNQEVAVNVLKLLRGLTSSLAFQPPDPEEGLPSAQTLFSDPFVFAFPVLVLGHDPVSAKGINTLVLLVVVFQSPWIICPVIRSPHSCPLETLGRISSSALPLAPIYIPSRFF